MHHDTWLIFIFLVEMGFHHVGQTGHELLTSSDPPALASQSAGIAGVNHCTQTGTFLKDRIVSFIRFLKNGPRTQKLRTVALEELRN